MQKGDIEKHYPDADFAVGIPAWPEAWRDAEYLGRVERSIALKAAGNEYEPSQVIVIAHKSELENVRIEVSDLTGNQGTISASNVEIAPQGWRKLQGEPGWVADMLRPDVRSFPVKKGSFQPVWINVHVPPDTKAGTYAGNVTIHADGKKSESLNLTLDVWPFSLPKYSALPTAANFSPADTNPATAEAIIARRWNPFQMYRWDRPADPAVLKQWKEQGALLNNLLQISRFSAKYEAGPDGKPIVANKDLFYRKLDPVVGEIQKNHPDLWPNVLLYGFDEPSVEQAIAMVDFYGDLKKRYGGIRTMFADLYGMWELLPELPANVDDWAVSREILTPEARDLIQKAGMKVWWYNAYSNPEDPVGARIQYWSTFKDKLDGIVYYNLDAGGGGMRNHGKNPWEATLWPSKERFDGGMMRLGPNGEPVPSVTFENWREGMEDIEYLHLLKNRRQKLLKHVGGNPTQHQHSLLKKSQQLLEVPDSLTTGLLGDRGQDIDELVVAMSGHTKNMDDILQARAEIARLIVEIDSELTRAQ